jgi:metal-responsive CopG/Arc/MetJ family transcriptional regulator
MQEKIKITLSLDKRTLDLLDSYVEDNYLNSKSQAIRVLVNKYARQSEDRGKPQKTNDGI